MQKAPDQVMEIFLQPGEFYFGDRDTRIRTLLGSCIAVTLWHPKLLIGGMCHYMLPGSRRVNRSSELDGRYADDAMFMFLEELALTGTRPKDYEAKMFGGGSQFSGNLRSSVASMNVPENNIDAGYALLAQHGFILRGEHLGGYGHRNVIFDVWSGNVWMAHVEHCQSPQKGMTR
jgi:chemotaxis protein CheD